MSVTFTVSSGTIKDSVNGVVTPSVVRDASRVRTFLTKNTEIQSFLSQNGGTLVLSGSLASMNEKAISNIVTLVKANIRHCKKNGIKDYGAFVVEGKVSEKEILSCSWQPTGSTIKDPLKTPASECHIRILPKKS